MAWCFVNSKRESSMALNVMTNESQTWTSATSHYLNKKIKIKQSHIVPPVNPTSSNSYDRHEPQIWCNRRHPEQPPGKGRLRPLQCAVSQGDPRIFGLRYIWLREGTAVEGGGGTFHARMRDFWKKNFYDIYGVFQKRMKTKVRNLRIFLGGKTRCAFDCNT